ncbi:MAG: RidA family protein [Gemmataceae bacterium]|nr:RidA family protein [Gemmataceae bacterium]
MKKLAVVGLCAFAVGFLTKPEGEALLSLYAAQLTQGGKHDPEARLRELGIELPKYVRPNIPIAPVVVVGNLAFVSGHTPSGKIWIGRVGEDLDIAAGKAAAKDVGLRILSALREELGDLKRVRRVVKAFGMVNCPPGYKDQPTVINGFSELMIDVFGKERGTGARSAVGMSSLPGNAAVEVEAIFEIEAKH